MAEPTRVGHCALCGNLYENWGHNPQPVLPDSNQRVCQQRNDDTVLPVRLNLLKLPWIERVRKQSQEDS